MHFLRVNVTFYDVFKMIHDVITTRNPFPYIAKFMFVGVKIIKFNKSDIERKIEYAYSVVVYQKYLTRLGELIIFSPRLDIFDMRQHYIRIHYKSICEFTRCQNDILPHHSVGFILIKKEQCCTRMLCDNLYGLMKYIDVFNLFFQKRLTLV